MWLIPPPNIILDLSSAAIDVAISRKGKNHLFGPGKSKSYCNHIKRSSCAPLRQRGVLLQPLCGKCLTRAQMDGLAIYSEPKGAY